MRSSFSNLGLSALLVPVVIILTSGCGPGGPERYRMSGNVTFEGKPVPSGTVSFEPAEKGVGGGFAPIKDGKYDTAVDGRGHLGGEHTVQIVGFEGVEDPDSPNPTAKPMFAPYKTTIELPEETTTRDFEVPADSKAPEVPDGNPYEE